jgi:hypothetical protein
MRAGRRHHRRTVAAVLTALALMVAGCGLEDPYANQPEDATEETASTTTEAPQPPEAAPGREPAGRRDALERFAQTWMTWSFETLADTRKRLAALAGEALRERMLRYASDAEDDLALRTANSSNGGSVEGVLLRRGAPALVVTRETTRFGDGGEQSGYFVYEADAEQIDGTWKVVEWRPLP